MRLAILLAGGVATGALSGVAIQTVAPPNAPMLQAVRALGGDVAKFKLTDVNPLKAYEDVKRQITSGNLGGSLNLGSSKPIVTSFPKVGSLSLDNNYHIDDGAIRRAVGAGINSRAQQDIRRAQDLAAFSRNPTGWHGAPPH
jgi:hypothetical protein